MKLETTASFRRCLRGLSDERLALVLSSMRDAAAAYGQPHLHAGIGLRVIGDWIECRDALDFRLIFQREGGALVFSFYGRNSAILARRRNSEF